MPVSTDLNLRRRHLGFLGTGLVLLALWVQALAPLVTLRMVLAAPEMPGAVLCGHLPDGDAIGASLEQPVAPPTCDVCRLCRAGMVPPPHPKTPDVARLLRWTAPAWPIPPPSDPKPAPRVAGQPRAPPLPA
ncbi:DUF2946 family protein [Methylobacterium pseudosasicola]|uniref:DUF2946 domain-containing protein n=1 Tax=Methylobacterium pseudosasicola TaxID=582667 RepID=A0A1I4MT39_9HYPH|nr:DUF2946 family protein [Methylobacterium pseudosasicola]SFM06230.1 Protein of unknown function [Methylobacterium pseudosasicola]